MATSDLSAMVLWNVRKLRALDKLGTLTTNLGRLADDVKELAALDSSLSPEMMVMVDSLLALAETAVRTSTVIDEQVRAGYEKSGEAVAQ